MLGNFRGKKTQNIWGCIFFATKVLGPRSNYFVYIIEKVGK